MSNFISKISFSRLRKDELKMFASRVITIVEKHDPENLKINETFDLLVELQPQIESLVLGYIAHPITEPLDELRLQRSALAKGIIDQIKALEKGKVTGMAESIKVAKPIVLQHLQGLGRCADTKAYQNVNSFSREYRLNLDLQTAVLTLKLTSYYDSLLDVNQTIESHLSDRTQDYSERSKGITVVIVREVTTSLQSVFKHIDVSSITNQGLDYIPLIDELNEEIVLTKAKLKTRSTNYKKKAEGVLNNNEVVINNIVVVEDEPEESSEPNRSNNRMYPMGVEGVNGENSGELDIIKTVAMSSNHNDRIIV